MLLQWPVIIILHYVGVEPFELPPPPAQDGIAINIVLDIVLTAANFVGIAFTSPLFITVGSILTIPVSVLADKFVNNFLLPVWAFIGMALIMVGFLLLNIDVYLKMRAEKEQPTEGQNEVIALNTEKTPLLGEESSF